MKICVISTNIMPCPPVGYSGLEMLAWQIAKGLGEKGHQILLVAPKGSIATKNVELHETTLGESEKQSYSGYWNRLNNFDCIIDHSWQKYSYFLKMEGNLKCPILGVTHAPINTMYSSPPPVDKPCFVSISQDQANHTVEHLKCQSRVAYNGIDVDFYKPLNHIKKSERYLFLARISTIKGPDIALRVAERCGIGLDIVGDDTMTGEPQLVQTIKQHSNLLPNMRYIGPQSREQCVRWFNYGKALLHPNLNFREPFGLAPLEAQLCGTPVIAWNNGAMNETICHGETGFIVNSEIEMENLIKSNAVSTLNPKRCREWASQFSYDRMINRYEELCNEAIQTGGW